MTTTPAAGAICLTPTDNVATVLRAIAPGEQVVVQCGGNVITILAVEHVPLCHKISLEPIGADTQIVKYGQPIGLALVPIERGHHVHVHNMRSARGRSKR